MANTRKEQMITVTMPLEVFDRLFQILGNYSSDPDTSYILSTLYASYVNANNPGDEPLKYITDENYHSTEAVLMREKVNAKI